LDYDIEYYENMLRNYSKTAEAICNIRWNWIAELKPKVVLDYGCGVGWFRAFRPLGVDVYTYDIGNYVQTGIPFKIFDVCCFFDVLEHINDFSVIEPVLRLSNHATVSIPIKSLEEKLSSWKHFKPSEHLHLFTKETLCALFDKYDFYLIKEGTPECPPRKEISSFIFKRNKI
jgi:hypothetical protein